MNAKPLMRCEINVTPLVDVTLVLLIIFMVVSPMMLSSYEVMVPPKAVDPNPVLPPDQIVLTQAPSGTLYLNHEEIDINHLTARLQGTLEHRIDKTVFYSAADELNYGVGLTTMDLLHAAGARIAIVTDDLSSSANFASLR